MLTALILGRVPHAVGQPRAGTVDQTTPSGVAYDATGRGKPLLLIHGFTADRRMWDPVVSSLVRAGYRVIRMDLRSHGRSAASGAAHRNDDDVLAVMDAARASRVIVVGHSAGAAAAMEAALARPAAIAGLVLVSASINGLTLRARPPDMAELVRLLRAGEDSAATAAWLRLPIMQLAGDSATRARFRAMVQSNARVWRAAPPAPQTPAPWSRIDELGAPIVVVSGADDAASREVADSLLARRHATAIVAGASGHWVPLERPGVVLEALRLLDLPR